MTATLSRFLFLLGLALPVACPAQHLLIRDVTLVSPEREAALKGAHVRIRDGRIAEVSAAPLETAGAEVIEGRGRYLTPAATGLVAMVKEQGTARVGT